MQDFHCLLQLTKQPLFLNTPKHVLFYIIRNQGERNPYNSPAKTKQEQTKENELG